MVRFEFTIPRSGDLELAMNVDEIERRVQCIKNGIKLKTPVELTVRDQERIGKIYDLVGYFNGLERATAHNMYLTKFPNMPYLRIKNPTFGGGIGSGVSYGSDDRIPLWHVYSIQTIEPSDGSLDNINDKKTLGRKIKTALAALENSLVTGWQEFRGSEDFRQLRTFYMFLKRAGFYESMFRGGIANPAYDNAAKLVGRRFLQVARMYELYFDEIFPGNFLESEEFDLGEGVEARRFSLQAYHRTMPFGIFYLTFAHLHNGFDFPSPPKLELILSSS